MRMRSTEARAKARKHESKWRNLGRASLFRACSVRDDGRWDWACGGVSLFPWLFFQTCYLLLRRIETTPEWESGGGWLQGGSEALYLECGAITTTTKRRQRHPQKRMGRLGRGTKGVRQLRGRRLLCLDFGDVLYIFFFFFFFLMWDLPGPGLEPMSPALAGGFSTTAPPGKPRTIHFNRYTHYCLIFMPIESILGLKSQTILEECSWHFRN